MKPRHTLRKACLTGKVSGWDDTLATITMGYRMSTHESLAHFSSYYLLFGRKSLLDRSVSNRLRELPELDQDDKATWVAVVTARAKAFKRGLLMTIRNLTVAQARDRVRHAYTKGESYRPRPKQYWVGGLCICETKGHRHPGLHR